LAFFKITLEIQMKYLNLLGKDNLKKQTLNYLA